MPCPGFKRPLSSGARSGASAAPLTPRLSATSPTPFTQSAIWADRRPSLSVAWQIRRELGLSQTCEPPVIPREPRARYSAKRANLTKPDPSPKRLSNWSGGRLGEKSDRYANGLAQLGEILRQQKDFAGARRLFEQERALRRELVGEKHPTFAYCLNRLGRVSRTRATWTARKRYTYRRWTSSLSRSRFPGRAVKIGAVRYWNGVIHDNLESLAVARQLRRAPERDRLWRLVQEARSRGDSPKAVGSRTSEGNSCTEDFGPLADELATSLEQEARLRVEAADFVGAKKTLKHLEDVVKWRLVEHWQRLMSGSRSPRSIVWSGLIPNRGCDSKRSTPWSNKAEAQEKSGRMRPPSSSGSRRSSFTSRFSVKIIPGTPALIDRPGNGRASQRKPGIGRANDRSGDGAQPEGDRRATPRPGPEQELSTSWRWRRAGSGSSTRTR